jgi:two-component system cell cycle sensor histidine kinase/response regulator CckA
MSVSPTKKAPVFPESSGKSNGRPSIESGKSGRILLVNDNPNQLDALSLILSQSGYSVRAVESGGSALEALVEDRPDLIISDVVMPGIDGIQLCRSVKSIQEIAATPVLLISGLRYDDSAIEEGLEAGAADYLEIDAPVALLTKKVERLIQETREKRARQEAEQALVQLASIVDCSNDAIIGHSPQGFISSWNSGAERIFGYRSDEVRGKHIGFLLHSNAGDQPHILERVQAGGLIENYEMALVRRDGKLIDVSITISPILGQQGVITGYSTIARDVSERKLLEEQLIQSQKMNAIGRLAGGIAHDFNNLLTAILGYCQLAERLLIGDTPLAGYISEMRKAGEQAASLTSQLLAFSRQQVVRPEVLDINAVLKDFDGILRRLIGEDVELILISGPHAGLIRANASQIQQVIVNLVVNARDSMPGGGRLVIETAGVLLDDDYAKHHMNVQPGPYVTISVSDTGTGIDRETLQHIFEPFYTTKGLGKGTGLGLSTVYGIVEQAGGHIDVISEVGRGTTFRINLPQVCGPAPKPEVVPDLLLARTVGKQTLLLVEDEETVRRLTSEVLRQCGYAVIEAESGPEAIRLTENHPGQLDLLLTDVMLPGMGGAEVARRLCQMRPALRVLYMSGYLGTSISRQGVEFSPSNFIQKPFTPADLAQKVLDCIHDDRTDD